MDISGVEDISGGQLPNDFGTFVPPPYLYDIADLALEHDELLQKEATDRALVETIEFPDVETLRTKLIEWATQKFIDGFPIFSIKLDPPPVCMDGVSRKLFDYVAYLAGVPIGEKMQRLTNKLKGMYVQCSYSGSTITFHAFKASSTYTGAPQEDSSSASTYEQDTLPPADDLVSQENY
jgi:hypothetical protein